MNLDMQSCKTISAFPVSENETPVFYGDLVQKSIGVLWKEQNVKTLLVLYEKAEWKNTTWYRQMIQSLKAEQILPVELECSNCYNYYADLETMEQAIEFCKKEQVDSILAVGGCNVIHSAKVIAIGAVCEETVWSCFEIEEQPERALPVSVFLTIPGSGSARSDRTMLVNGDTFLKRDCSSPVLRPKFCLVNPELFCTISEEGLADLVVQLLQRLISSYFLCIREGKDSEVCKKKEEQMQSLLKNSRILKWNRFDKQAWMELVLLDVTLESLEQDACQNMAIGFSVLYQVSYGALLAVLLPAWIRYIFESNQDIVLPFAQNLLGVSRFLPAQEQMQQAVWKLEDFFSEFGMKKDLCALGIQEFCFKSAAQICTSCCQEKTIGTLQVLNWKEIVQIYQSVYLSSKLVADNIAEG